MASNLIRSKRNFSQRFYNTERTLNNIRKRPIPKKIAESTVTSPKIAAGAVTVAALDTSVTDYVVASSASKNRIYRQATAPTGSALVEGDLWFDTANGNRLSRRESGVWVLFSLGAAATTGLAVLASTNTFTTNQVVSGSSSSAMLKITQTGAGDAILVEDAASTDSTPFVVDATGRVGVGLASVSGSQMQITNGTAADIGLLIKGASSQSGNYFELQTSSSSTVVSVNSSGLLSTPGGSLGRGAPVTKTADFSVGTSENWLINNKSGSTCTVTLPTASTWTGREIMIKNLQTQAVVSASSNVVPIDSAVAGTSILPSTVGAWATLVSDGSNWVVMQRG